VSSLSSLQTAINNANPGDLIMMANGTYTGSSAISITSAGTSSAHITIAATSIGGVTIGGTAAFQFASPAAFIDVEGFVFTHSNSISIPAGTNHIRFTRNVIQLAIPAGSDVSYINIAGDDVQIDYNELRNKSTLGEMLDISGSGSQVARRLWVHHNYFHDFSSPGGNGAETIRWGLSGLSLSTGDGICEYNLFVRCTGENELISNKSSGNIYRYNTFLDSVGGEMSQRHGNYNQIYGNIFKNTQGIRIYGDNNAIFCNYLEGNSDGINIGNGDGEVENGAPLTSHDKPDNTLIAFNTLINNTLQYEMGGRTGGLGAANTTFANNIIVGGGPAASISTTAPYTGAVWEGNIIFNTTAGDMPAGTYRTVDPLLAADANGVSHLQSGSPAIGTAVGTYSTITVDQDGQPRPSTGKDVGADEVSTAPIIARILTASDVGPNAGGTVAAPTFTLAAGTYTGPQNITIASSTSGASIRYTTDGSTPTSSTGNLYSGPVTLSANTTLKAIAFKTLLTDSSVTSGSYTIRVFAPTFTPAAGTYTGAQSVTISSATPGASIRYTLDGSTPTSTTGTLYTGAVTISSSATLKAIAFNTGMADSTVTSGAYTINSSGGTTVTSADGFVNRTLGSSQTGLFTVQVDASVSISPSNTTFSLCQGSQTAYTGLACMIRFNTTGTIDARNGGAFAAVTSMPFSANTTYHLRFDVNVTKHTYSAYVTAPSGSPVTIASDYAFRTEQAGATAIDTFNVDVNATPGGSATYGATTTNAAAKITVPGTSVIDSSDDGNVAANVVDGNLATRWSASGDGQWIRLDLGSTKNVSQVKVAFYQGDTRTSTFDVQVSSDGTTFTTVKSFTSSGTTTALESFDIPDKSARYVRLLGHGNSVNLWNSYTEVEIWGF
jgi:poly(beta-D-mannuronate) lyase